MTQSPFRWHLVVTGMIAIVACGGGDTTSPPPPPPPTPPPPTPVASVLVQPEALNLAPGQAAPLTATPRDAGGNPLSGRTMAWSSSNAAAASVSTAGLVTAVAPGNAIISATSEGRTGVAQVTVLAPVASVTLQPEALTLAPGQTAPLTATPRDAGGNPLTGRPVTWSTSNAAAATVSTVGVVTAVAAGTAVITAMSEGRTGVAQVTVVVPVASVTVQPTALSLAPGQTGLLTATPRDAGGNPLTGRPVTWSTSNAAAATVSTVGVVTAVATGTANITAMSEGQSGIAVVTVQPLVANVTLTGAQRVKVGDEYQYTATARTADNTIVNRPVFWSVLVPGSAVITAAGRLTPLQTGIITIVATIDGQDWTGTTTAYDWGSLSTGGSQFVFLDADLQLTTRHGATTYPELVVSCSGTGKMFIWVDTRVFITASGSVSFFFDDGPILSQTWLEFDSFRALGHPGPTNLQVKAYLANLTAARRFGFAFGEFLGSAKATLFRVTGLAPRLAPLLAACPSNSLVGPMAAPPTVDDIEAVKAQLRAPTVLAAERVARLQAGPAGAAPLAVTLSERGEEVQVMVRKQ